jgi:hypothetical protein
MRIYLYKELKAERQDYVLKNIAPWKQRLKIGNFYYRGGR